MTDKQPEALRLADELDGNLIAVANGEMKLTKFSIEPISKAAAELRRLHQSEREGWRYANELEQERKRLHEVNTELVEALSWFVAAVELSKASYALAKAQGENND